MSDSDRQALRTTWRQMQQRYRWQLVDDEEPFLDEAIMLLHQQLGNRTEHVSFRLAVWRAYSVRLYRGFWHRQQQAAEEIWQLARASALKKGLRAEDAEEIAQETVLRMWEELPRLRAPSALLTWSFRVFRTAWNKVCKPTPTLPLQNNDGTWVVELEDPANIASDVETMLIYEALEALLQTEVANPRERYVLVRTWLFEEKPREIASQLGIKAHQVAMIRYRAMGRISNKPHILQGLREILGGDGEQLDHGGDTDGSE